MRQFDIQLFRCQFNREMVMSVVQEGEDLVVRGSFRTLGDLGGLEWKAEDDWSHFLCKYSYEPSFAGVVLQYDYIQSGPVAPCDVPGGQAHSLTVWTDDGEAHYININRHIVSGGPTNGRFRFDFDNLYGGWGPLYPDWHKIDANRIVRLLWSFAYDGGKKFSKKPIEDGTQQFTVRFNNFKVIRGKYIGGDAFYKYHLFRMACGYDNNYNMNPKRVVGQFCQLGFRDWIDFYIGASHYYEKKALRDSNGDFIKIPGTRDESLLQYNWLGEDDIWDYEFEIDTSVVLNHAAEAWFKSFFEAAKEYNYKVIGSISLENCDWPHNWVQLGPDGSEGHSGWEPPTKFCSFCNDDVIEFNKRLFQKVAQMQVDAGLQPVLQLGEPWWWSNAFISEDNQGAPCFYDQATKDKFLAEKGYELPEYDSIWEESFDEVAISWLRDQVGEFTWKMRNHIKHIFPNALFCVLFFPPSVIDQDRVGKMMSMVNFPKGYWANPNLDFFQVEDYDWIIDDDPDHALVYSFASDELGYDYDKTHYFAGFVLNPDPWETSSLWRRIDKAALDGLTHKFQVFIWAATQIQRDGWKPPTLSGEWGQISFGNDFDIPTYSAGEETMSPVEIINWAFAMIGVEPIVSLADNTQRAKLAKRIFSLTVKELLSAADWNFATRTVALPRLEDNDNPFYDYAFSLPSGFLKAVSLQDTGNNPVDYEMEGNTLFCNKDTVYLTYIGYTDNEDIYFMPFISALRYKLAFDMCVPLTGRNDISKNMYTLFNSQLRDAKALDAQQQRGKTTRFGSEWLQARYMG